MFIRFFRSSFAAQYLVIGLIGFILWGKAFILPPHIPPPEGPVPLYSLLYSLLGNLPHLSVILGFLLVLLETWWLNIMFNRHELVLKNSSLASLVFLIMMSSSPIYLTIHPLNISIVITLLILNSLMKSYNRSDDLDLVYGAGFLAALGSLFYFPYLLMLGILPVCFVLFRSVKWREWAAGVIGVLTPYFFLAVFYFLTDQLRGQIVVYEKMLASFFFYPIHLHTDDWVSHPTKLFRLNLGADGGIRSPALLITDQPLFHLSYTSLLQYSPIQPCVIYRSRRASASRWRSMASSSPFVSRPFSPYSSHNLDESVRPYCSWAKRNA